MKEKKNKSKVMVFLILVTLLVWGGIIYYIIGFYKAYNESTNETVSSPLEGVKPKEVKQNIDLSGEVTYQILERDPFQSFRQIEQVSVIEKVPKVESPKIIPPPPRISQYKIMGTIINGDSRLVILEGENNETHFLRVGESYKEVTIKSISLEKIELLENKVLKEIPIRK